MRLEWQMWAGEASVLDRAMCAEIVAKATRLLPEQPATLADGNTEPAVRKSFVRWVPTTHLEFTGLYDFVDRRIREANRNAFGFDLDWLSDMQFTTYMGDESGHYSWHMDTFLILGRKPVSSMRDRKLSCSLQLSDPADYEGGDLELDVQPPVDKEQLRKQGAMIVFPGFMRHRVTPVTAGVRHSLVAWMEGPFWR